jgi:NAD(P)-dependent dehydrogenase (short-subunit alcohol dehydrogenase family)
VNSETPPLSGQVAIVTGAGRGIGRAIALALAAAGARVVLTARSGDQLAETAALIQHAGGQALVIPANVTDQSAIEALVRSTVEHFGPPDLLVNNAGMANPEAPIWELPADDWWQVLEVNVRGPFLFSRAVLPSMLARHTGRIINVASNAGGWPMPTSSAYSVSKAALLRLTDNLAEMVEGQGPGIFAISPGTVHTVMTDGVSIFKDLPEADWTPVERAGELCVFIASGAADRLAGRYIHVRDDVRDMVRRADEISKNDWYTLRLRRPE